MRKLFIKACLENGIKKRDAVNAYKSFIESIKNELASGGSVVMRGIGTLKKAKRKARKIINPATGETINVPERELVVFKRSKGTLRV